MAQNRILLDESIVIDLRSLISQGDFLDLAACRGRGWKLVCFDDKAIYDSDADRLAAAVQSAGHNSICAVVLSKLRSETTGYEAIEFPATKAGIEEWQGSTDDDVLQTTLNTSIIFDKMVDFVVLRTGDVGYTIYAGAPAFLKMATDVDVTIADVYAIGRFVNDQALLKMYSPIVL